MITPMLGLTLILDMDLFLVGSFQHQNLSTWKLRFSKNIADFLNVPSNR